jgi:hypothetical protein
MLGDITATIANRKSLRSGADLSALELAEHEARAELEAFASDLTLRRVLRASYHAHLLEREAAVSDAADAYREACKAAVGERITYTADDLADDPATVARFLGSLYSVRVRPGRGLKIEDRVRFVPLDADDAIGIASA